MGTTWQYGPKQFDVVEGEDGIGVGDDFIIRLDVPHRGQIKAIQLIDSTGTAAGEFEIYDSEKIIELFHPPEPTDPPPDPEPVVAPPAVYSVTGPLEITDGQYSETQLELDYVNSDGTPTNNIRRLWMRINTNSAGPFFLKIVIAPVDLGS